MFKQPRRKKFQPKLTPLLEDGCYIPNANQHDEAKNRRRTITQDELEQGLEHAFAKNYYATIYIDSLMQKIACGLTVGAGITAALIFHDAIYNFIINAPTISIVIGVTAILCSCATCLYCKDEETFTHANPSDMTTLQFT